MGRTSIGVVEVHLRVRQHRVSTAACVRMDSKHTPARACPASWVETAAKISMNVCNNDNNRTFIAQILNRTLQCCLPNKIWGVQQFPRISFVKDFSYKKLSIKFNRTRTHPYYFIR